MLADRYDLALSVTSSAARDAYVQGCDLALTLYPALLKAYLNADRLEEARRLLSARRLGACGVPVAGVAAVR
jgi:hypothetical protein